jgi:hypothetical protein
LGCELADVLVPVLQQFEVYRIDGCDVFLELLYEVLERE